MARGAMSKTWSSSEIKRLREMRAEHCTVAHIAAELGRTRGSVERKITDLKSTPAQKLRRQQRERERQRRIRKARGPAIIGRKPVWSEQDIALLLSLRDEQKKKWPEIAQIMGHNPQKLYARYYYERRLSKSAREQAKAKTIVPEDVAKDWRHRSSLRPRDLTAAFMGDPPIGYSALEQRS